MLKFIKKLLAKEEKQEEKIYLDELSGWVDKKTKPIFENLKNEINDAVSVIDEEKERVFENLKKLENAKLQNPNIPERAKTVMQGNREAFLRKVSGFLNNIDLQYNDFYNLIEKCRSFELEIDELAKSTSRSYQILSQFFAREVSIIAENIKKIESNSKEIRSLIEHAKVETIDKIRRDAEDVKAKIKLRKRLEEEIKEEKTKLALEENKFSDAESKIKEAKGSKEYKQYENLLKEKEENEGKLREIETRIFHDFSVLEKAMKKYSKIAFENEKLIENYLEDPIKAFANDKSMEIIKILENLSRTIQDNKLELDQRKNERALIKIKELDKEYFSDLKDRYKGISERLGRISSEAENNDAKKQLDAYNKELDDVKDKIEHIKNNIITNNHELEKINIGKLKESLQQEISKALNEEIVIL